jgi:serine/threonine protein kinase
MRYEPIAQIGRGGMAEVLLARVHAVGGVRRLAVLKRIWPELATDPDFVTMFMDEARLSLRLNHPNVVQTYEVITGQGELAIAMEYLDGQPLTRVLNRQLRGPHELGLPLRLRILANVLAGLEHAHMLTDLDGSPLEVVHRDVSPQNVFITYDGQVKLVDFGVAKTLSASHQTRPGTLKGKLAYMAPEQLQRVETDRRADLFAVGVMLWEMLAGRRMWHRMTEVEIVSHLASGAPLPPLPSDAGRPAALDAICARALDPDPARRYETAAEMELDLERVLIGAADSHSRNLGKLVSMAFAAERAERQAIIEPWVRQTSPGLPLVVVPSPAPDEPDIDIDLSGLQPEPGRRHVPATVSISVAAVPEAAPEAPLQAPSEMPTEVPPVRLPSNATGLLRLSAGLLVLALAGTGLLAGGFYRPSTESSAAGQGSGAGSSVVSAPVAPPAPAGRSSSTTVAATPEEPLRHRRRHRHASADSGGAASIVDGDAVLPPTDDSEQ